MKLKKGDTVKQAMVPLFAEATVVDFGLDQGTEDEGPQIMVGVEWTEKDGDGVEHRHHRHFRESELVLQPKEKEA